MKRFRILFLAAALSTYACAGLIGVPDLDYDGKASQGSPDGSVATGSSGGTSGGPGTGTSGGPGSDGGGPGTDGGPITCDPSKVQTDKLNCGRCGHDCLGGDCVAGQCKATPIGTVASSPLWYIVEHGNSLYVSASTTLTTQVGGIWRTPKAAGNPVQFVTLRDATVMQVVENTLYFVVDGNPADGADEYGGFYSCPLSDSAAACSPHLIAPATGANALVLSADGSLYYNDDDSLNGLMKYTPGGGAPTIFRLGWGFALNLFVDGTHSYYMNTFSPSNPDDQTAFLREIYPDGGDTTVLSQYQHKNATAGELRGSPNALYMTAYDWEETTGGVVRRVSRPGSVGTTPCDYGGIKNIRPTGLYVDATRIYWTNQGQVDSPFSNGSISYCELDGCCDTPTTPWTGVGQPVAITGDDKGLYWVTRSTGEIWKIAKP